MDALVIGNGGWCEVHGHDLGGRLYVRLARQSGGRWRVHEFYVENSEGSPIAPSALRRFSLAEVELAANTAMPSHTGGRSAADFLEEQSALPGPQLGVLASHLTTTWNPANAKTTNWVALSMLAQLKPAQLKRAGLGLVERVRHVKAPWDGQAADRSSQVALPKIGERNAALTDDFLRDVAAAYLSAASRGPSPAKVLAEQADVPVRTVHRWIYTARKRGLMPPGKQGQVS